MKYSISQPTIIVKRTNKLKKGIANIVQIINGKVSKYNDVLGKEVCVILQFNLVMLLLSKSESSILILPLGAKASRNLGANLISSVSSFRELNFATFLSFS
jgi:hypothetical protein